MLESSWVPAQLAASQEGLSSVNEWVSEWVSDLVYLLFDPEDKDTSILRNVG
jgi:hypothetical protein